MRHKNQDLADQYVKLMKEIRSLEKEIKYDYKHAMDGTWPPDLKRLVSLKKRLAELEERIDKEVGEDVEAS